MRLLSRCDQSAHCESSEGDKSIMTMKNKSVPLEVIEEMRRQFAKQPWTKTEIDHAISVLDELLEYRADSEQEDAVTVHKDGVQFGKWCWFSHESITGCEAALIPTKHKQYYEWFLQHLRESDRTPVAAPAKPPYPDYATTVFAGTEKDPKP